MQRLIFFIIFIMTLFSASVSQAVTFSIKMIDNNANSFHLPRINENGHVLWGNGNILKMYDGNQSSKIAENLLVDQLAGIPFDDYGMYDMNDKGDIIWSGMFVTGEPEIFKFDGSSKRSERISDNTWDPALFAFPDNFVDFSPKISEKGDAVWLDSTGKIYRFDAVTRNPLQIGEGSFPQINSKGDIAWFGKSCEIMLFEGASHNITKIAGNNVSGGSCDDNVNIQINSKGNIVWSLGNIIHLYDSASGNISLLSDNQNLNIWPQTNSQSDVVWTSDKLFRFDADAKTINPFGEGGARILPQINDNGDIVWYSFDGNDTEIMFFDGFTHKIIQVTNNLFDDLTPALNSSGQIVWIGDSENPGLFLAEPIPEPASYLLFSLGLIGLSALGSRFKKKRCNNKMIMSY